LGLVAEPHGQHSQQRPTEGKAEQNHAGEDILFCRDERRGDENQGTDQSSSQRSGDDQPNATPLRGLQAFRFLKVTTVWSRPRHGGLNSMKVVADASLWLATST
jgi:hypothetical protein